MRQVSVARRETFHCEVFFVTNCVKMLFCCNLWQHTENSRNPETAPGAGDFTGDGPDRLNLAKPNFEGDVTR